MITYVTWSIPKYGWLLAFVLAIALLAMFAGGKPVLAKGPAAPASCMGQEAAAISPPGSSDEVPRGMPEFMQFVRGLPGSPGSSISFIAGLHAGSHDACDAAIGG